MLIKVTESLARTIYDDEDDIELYAYGLQIFLSNVLELLFVVVLGLCIGRLFETIAFLGAFITLRTGAGGYHAKTFFRCFLGLLFVYGLHLAILSLTPVYWIYYLCLLLMVISIFPILKYAPVADPNKPIGPIQRKCFRKRSVVVFLIQAAIIVAMCGFGIAAANLGIYIADTIQYVLLSFVIGLATASGSVVAARIQNARGRANYDCQDDHALSSLLN